MCFELFGREAMFSMREHRVGFWIEQLDSRLLDAISLIFRCAMSVLILIDFEILSS